jgi:hypothetical protein
MRLINPEAAPRALGSAVPSLHDRARRPADECGVTDDAGAWAHKTKCALRSYCLWLHKGVDVIHFYAAWYKDAKEFGILPVGLDKLPVDARFDDVATPPLRAIRNLTRAFAGAAPIRELHPLSVDVAALGEPRKIFDGPRPLWNRDAFVFLPWQTGEREYAVGLYVMTWDAMADLPEERYRLTIKGAAAGKVALVDAVSGREIPVKIVRQESGLLEVEVPVIDTPRILTIR